MKVKDLMDRNVITVPADATYEQAVKILLGNQLGSAPVVDRDGYVVGMVSEKDLFRVLYPYYKSYYESPELYLDFEDRESKADEIRNHKVETFMSKQVITVGPETPVLNAGAIMLAKHVQRLPVVENNLLFGIITRKRIYEAVFQQNGLI